MSRETISEKALRYVSEERVRIRFCNAAQGVIRADVRGGGDYVTRLENGRWRCSCRARPGRCCHIAALRLIFEEPGE
jgi:hypothetical protein